MRILIDGLVFESIEAIQAYKERKLQAIEEQFAGVLDRQPTQREQDIADLASKRDQEKRADGWE
jgi:hypothetical protein